LPFSGLLKRGERNKALKKMAEDATSSLATFCDANDELKKLKKTRRAGR
jgi:hypothetical protein